MDFFQVRGNHPRDFTIHDVIESNNSNPFTESSIGQAWALQALLPDMQLRNMPYMWEQWPEFRELLGASQSCVPVHPA